MDNSANCKNYGVPIYGAGWVPSSALRSAVEPPADDEKDDGDKSSAPAPENYVVLAGGGGEGNSGIRNALVVAQFDFDSNVLSDEPVSLKLFLLMIRCPELLCKLNCSADICLCTCSVI